jgi:hypothetical protein
MLAWKSHATKDVPWLVKLALDWSLVAELLLEELVEHGMLVKEDASKHCKMLTML